MRRFLLHHRHAAAECGVAFAAFKGHASPLRHAGAVASCLAGDHAVWWVVPAASAAEALDQLPFFVAERTTVTEVREVLIP
jgi:hypothetical protein